MVCVLKINMKKVKLASLSCISFSVKLSARYSDENGLVMSVANGLLTCLTKASGYQACVTNS